MINGVSRTRTLTNGVYANSFSTGKATIVAADNSTAISRVSSFNSHDRYGAIVNLNKKLTQNLTLDFGIDARTYVGYHFQDLNSLLGGDVFLDSKHLKE